MNAFEIVSTAETRALIIQALHWIATIIEVIGVGVIVIATVVSTIAFSRKCARSGWNGALSSYRADLGRGILLGLEFLVAADIIGTVAVAPTFQSLGVLGLIITIRTLLSFSLEVEIEGRWPWKRHEAETGDRGHVN